MFYHSKLNKVYTSTATAQIKHDISRQIKVCIKYYALFVRQDICLVLLNISGALTVTQLYSKTCLKRPHKKKTKNCFLRPIFCLMQVKSIAECSKGSILQYFQPSLSYHLPVRPLFCLFLNGHLRQVLLYLLTRISVLNVTQNFFPRIKCS